jgi:hypothetical protein
VDARRAVPADHIGRDHARAVAGRILVDDLPRVGEQEDPQPGIEAQDLRDDAVVVAMVDVMVANAST